MNVNVVLESECGTLGDDPRVVDPASIHEDPTQANGEWCTSFFSHHRGAGVPAFLTTT